jgi:hypothetical protein
VTPLDDRARVETSLRRVHGLAFWLDDAFEIPIVKVRVGLDPIVGLVPVAGDWAMWLLSAYILIEAVRLEVPVRLLFRMACNIGLDLVAGAVPVIGDVADAALKANRKNARLLAEHCGATFEGPRLRFDGDPLARERSNAFSRWSVAILLLGALLALVSAPFLLIIWLFGE